MCRWPSDQPTSPFLQQPRPRIAKNLRKAHLIEREADAAARHENADSLTINGRDNLDTGVHAPDSGEGVCGGHSRACCGADEADAIRRRSRRHRH